MNIAMVLLIPIVVPLIAALLVLILPRGVKFLKEAAVFGGLLLTVAAAFYLFGENVYLKLPWAGFGMDFSLKLFHFSGFAVAAASSFAILIGIYCFSFMSGKDIAKPFYFYMLTSLAFVNGAVLSDNLVLMLFFWEGLLATLFGFIIIGGKNSFKTAIKAFMITGVADLCLMLGIALTAYLAKTFVISSVALSPGGLGAVAFTLLMIGAIAKAGSMPFHSWIPDAAVDAPLPFMAFLPASLEKIVGIYFLARISLNMFNLTEHSWVSIMMMLIGSITILLAVMMALIQKDYKRLLSYHAISQVGYMILGIGTALPAGIVGGIFHMINNAMYKSALFLTGGSVEKQTGTTDLGKLGGLWRAMPITFSCFVIAAVSISGVPPFNGFFSKELIYDAAFERGFIFYLAAVVGSFFTAASFLKLGHAAFLGKGVERGVKVKESSWLMLIPMIVIALSCVIFGVWNALPLDTLIQPILGGRLHGHSLAGWPTNTVLVLTTVIVLILAVLNHLFGVRATGKGAGAVDHIHYAPVLKQTYDLAEKRYFDPYDIGLKIVGWVSFISYRLDRAFDWIYSGAADGIAFALGGGIRKLHNGNYAFYLVWSFVGIFVLMAYIFMAR